MEHQDSKPPLNFRAELIDWIKTIGITVIVALLIHQFVFTLARVDGPSMNDTLYTDQVMAVVRATYLFREPKRGEVVLCRYRGWKEDCVKRVIGLPGERVKVVDNIIYINDQPIDNAATILVQTGDFQEFTVPMGEYFVMGDNRSRSLDSREPSVSSLPRSGIKGLCVAVIWPIGQWTAIK